MCGPGHPGVGFQRGTGGCAALLLFHFRTCLQTLCCPPARARAGPILSTEAAQASRRRPWPGQHCRYFIQGKRFPPYYIPPPVSWCSLSRSDAEQPQQVLGLRVYVSFILGPFAVIPQLHLAECNLAGNCVQWRGEPDGLSARIYSRPISPLRSESGASWRSLFRVLALALISQSRSHCRCVGLSVS